MSLKIETRIITAAAEVGSCPLHSHEKYKALYEKLAESSHEESDMEPSDAESDDGHQAGQVRNPFCLLCLFLFCMRYFPEFEWANF